jgi:hypothetical protein
MLEKKTTSGQFESLFALLPMLVVPPERRRLALQVQKSSSPSAFEGWSPRPAHTHRPPMRPMGSDRLTDGNAPRRLRGVVCPTDFIPNFDERAQSGNPGCMSCYLSEQNDQQVVATPGVVYNFEAGSNVICSVFGTFWSNLSNMQIELATTHSQTLTSQPLSTGVELCILQPWCTAATTPPDCNPQTVTQLPLLPGAGASCSSYYNTYWGAERSGPGTNWTCVNVETLNSTDSTQAACSRHP